MDKTQNVLEFLLTCPHINEHSIFFNFANAEDGNFQVNVNPDDISLAQPYIDGSVSRRYTCTIDSFKSFAFNPMQSANTDENFEDFTQAQSIIDWINEQGELRNFPNFGDDFIIDEMRCLTSRPRLVGLNTKSNPPLAVYRISIQIDYLDMTKVMWK